MVSIPVEVDELFDEIERWTFCYLLTVRDDQRVHLLALRPAVADVGGERRLRFEVGGGSACTNATARPEVTLVFPPEGAHDGYSLVVDGTASVDGGVIDVRPTGAVLHRPAP